MSCPAPELEDCFGGLTSAVLGTLSQKTSILMSPRVVCSVTDMVEDADACQHRCRERGRVRLKVEC